MSNFDDLFEAKPQQEQEDRPFDKEAWAEKKQAERQEVYELADATTQEVAADGDKYKAFPRACPSNAMRATSRSWRRATTMSVPMAALAPHGT